MVSEQQQRCRSDDASSDDEVGGLTEAKEIEKGDDGKFDDTMVLLPSAVSKEEGHDGNSSIQKATSSILERKRPAFPASSFEFVPILKRAKVSASSKKTEEWHLTPVSIFIRILGYLDNATLMMMCLVCKQINTIIWNGIGMEHQLVRILELRPSDNHDYMYDRIRIQSFFNSMNRYFQDDTKKRMLQGYQHWKIHDLKEIIDDRMLLLNCELQQRTRTICLNGIKSLDVSSPVPTDLGRSNWSKLFRCLSFVVPNLRHLDLSKTRMNIVRLKEIITVIAESFPYLEIITWNNIPTLSSYSELTADGADLKSIRTLKELHLDNNIFFFHSLIQNNGENDASDDLFERMIQALTRVEQIGDGGNHDDDDDDTTEFEAMSDLNNHPHTFLFYKLCHKALEGVSIRNMTACFFDDGENHPLHHPLPQTALVKFVRNAPTTLKWFRSDLTQDNITMLQSERPGIKFLN